MKTETLNQYLQRTLGLVKEYAHLGEPGESREEEVDSQMAVFAAATEQYYLNQEIDKQFNEHLQSLITRVKQYSPNQEDFSLNVELSHISNMRILVLENYDSLEPDHIERLSKKLSLAERLYADIREMDRLDEGKKWEAIARERMMK
jgi:hypothetical protein